jgi:acyl-CoA synthetase (AMP-forming)/AMP-acid ligase II
MTITALSRQDIADRDHPRWAERLGSAGRAYACSEVMIADADDRPLPCGEAGEVLCRGVVMRGYWRNAEASAATLKGGWPHTATSARSMRKTSHAQGLLQGRHHPGWFQHLSTRGREALLEHARSLVMAGWTRTGRGRRLPSSE